MAKDIPSPELLRKLLRYDPNTGHMVWLPRTDEMFKEGNRGRKSRRISWNSVNSGKPALTSVKENEYLYGRILNKNYYAHRVAWAVYYGDWPKGLIDHKDGNRQNNKISNLRVVSQKGNGENKSVRSDRVFSGIYLDRRDSSWYVQVRKKSVFRSKCFGESMLARNKEYRRQGFSSRHIMPTLKATSRS